jgi:hypothetical protein
MCAITGSFSREKTSELIALNSYRGGHSSSISALRFDKNPRMWYNRRLGEINHSYLTTAPGDFWITHQQAPTTTERKMDSVHPAAFEQRYNQNQFGEQLLWHNGIVKEECIKDLQYYYNLDYKWDTKLILYSIMKDGYEALNKIDGSFSCLYYDGVDLFLFRNEISPMFIDDELTFSSTKFEGSRETEPNKVWRLNLIERILEDVATFKTIENPYYFG